MTISIVETRPDSADAIQLIGELDEQLMAHAYPQGSRHALSVDRLVREAVAFYIVRMDGDPAGCGGVKLHDDYAEVKRMYVRPEHRSKGLGRAVLRRLEEHARQSGIGLLRLETGIYQTEAIRLYEHYGFRRCAPFGEYLKDPFSVYFEKPID
jgi:GNAT superfamily N-acetyltransferase